LTGGYIAIVLDDHDLAAEPAGFLYRVNLRPAELFN